MVDVSLQVVVNAGDHAVAHAENRISRQRRGDIVAVIRTNTFATMQGGGEYRVNGGIGSKRLGFIHITDLPNNKAQKIRRLAQEQVTITEDEYDDIDQVTRQVEVAIRKFGWRVNVDAVPNALKLKMADQREFTVSWDQVKGQIFRKIATSKIERMSDTERAVSDSDLDD